MGYACFNNVVDKTIHHFCVLLCHMGLHRNTVISVFLHLKSLTCSCNKLKYMDGVRGTPTDVVIKEREIYYTGQKRKFTLLRYKMYVYILTYRNNTSYISMAFFNFSFGWF